MCKDFFHWLGAVVTNPKIIGEKWTPVRGAGAFENGVERCRTRVTLATGIPEPLCRKINLGYRDPGTIRVEEFADREDEGILLVRKAGERLYRLHGGVN